MPKFSKKHYVAIADLLSHLSITTKTPSAAVNFADMLDSFIELFKTDNPNFDEARFIGAVNKGIQ